VIELHLSGGRAGAAVDDAAGDNGQVGFEPDELLRRGRQRVVR
jgi:hypothetical protein